MTREEIFDFCEMKSQLEPENEDIFNYIIETLEQNMRDATPEEREGVDKYIKNISTTTGVDFWDSEKQPYEEKESAE